MTSNEKRRVLLDFSKLTPTMREALAMQYPFGINEKAIRIPSSQGKRRLAIVLETEEATLLVSIDPTKPESAWILGEDDMLSDSNGFYRSDDDDDDDEAETSSEDTSEFLLDED